MYPPPKSRYIVAGALPEGYDLVAWYGRGRNGWTAQAVPKDPNVYPYGRYKVAKKDGVCLAYFHDPVEAQGFLDLAGGSTYGVVEDRAVTEK